MEPIKTLGEHQPAPCLQGSRQPGLVSTSWQAEESQGILGTLRGEEFT